MAAADLSTVPAPGPRQTSDVERRLGVVAPPVLWIGSGWSGAGRDLLAGEVRPFRPQALETAVRGSLDRLGYEPVLLHVEATEGVSPRRLRRRFPRAAIVLDVRDASEASARWALRRVDAADLVLVDSQAAMERLALRRGRRPVSAAVLGRPLDLGAHAPVATLRSTRDAELKRFLRLHRLQPPVVLFAGPYRAGGGLDRAIEAMELVRRTYPAARLAAVPHGPTDQRYLDRCERRILSFGHHGVVQWSVPSEELSLWYATADVVCLPADEDVGGRPADLAAAAGRPFVGTSVPSLRERVDHGRTGLLVPRGDVGALADAVTSLLADAERSSHLGEEARRRAEEALAPASCGAQLRTLWLEALARAGR